MSNLGGEILCLNRRQHNFNGQIRNWATLDPVLRFLSFLDAYVAIWGHFCLQTWQHFYWQPWLQTLAFQVQGLKSSI